MRKKESKLTNNHLENQGAYPNHILKDLIINQETDLREEVVLHLQIPYLENYSSRELSQLISSKSLFEMLAYKQPASND